MGWSIGYDENHGRDVGYGVPAFCDHPDCNEKIDRGIAHVCGGELFGGENGCGLHFCGKHLSFSAPLCERCREGEHHFTPKSDHPDWMRWKLEDQSWEAWRKQNPVAVEAMRLALAAESEPAKYLYTGTCSKPNSFHEFPKSNGAIGPCTFCGSSYEWKA